MPFQPDNKLISRLGRHAFDPQVQRLLKLPHRMARNGRKLDVSQSQSCRYLKLTSRVTVSIAFGGSQLILAAATLYHEDYVPTAWQTLLVYWASLIGSLLINLFFAA